MTKLDLQLPNLADPLIEGINNIAPRLPRALVTLLAGYILIKLFSVLARAVLSAFRLPQGLRGILVSLIDALLWIFLIISILQSLGLDRLALIVSGSLAASGLALAMGASSLVADIIAGIFLSRDRDFSVGDEVTAGENTTTGTIESMDMRRTRIRDKNGQLHVIPNSVVERKEWIVLAKKPTAPRKVRRTPR